MRIGIEAQRLLRRKKHGMEIVSLELIRHLQQIDQDNEYVVFTKSDEDAECIASQDNFEIVKTPSLSYPYWEQFYLPKIARAAKIDLLHCTSNTAPVFYASPMVLTLHDVIYLEKISFKGTAYQNFGNLYRRFVVPKVVGACQQILTVSEYEKKQMLDYLDIDADKIQVIYNAASSAFTTVDDPILLEQISQKYNLPQEYILFFGNIAPKKNTTGVIKAYCHYFHHQHQPLPLVVADAQHAYIDAEVGRWAGADHQLIKKHITVLDHIGIKDLPCLYGLSTMFLYTSLRESFGLPIIEAMACGVPVITSSTSAMPEVAGGAACLVDPFDALAIAEGIQKVQADTALRASLIGKGKIRAGCFSWEKTAEQVLKVYQKPGRIT